MFHPVVEEERVLRVECLVLSFHDGVPPTLRVVVVCGLPVLLILWLPLGVVHHALDRVKVEP